MEEKLQAMVGKIKEAFGDQLKSVMLYGSKANGDIGGKCSDYNTLVDSNDASFVNQQKLAPLTADWIKAGSPPPQVFSARMFDKSNDVFPIEFLDMKAHHKVLYGDDPLQGVKVDMSNLRHQCEFELKGKLLALRQAISPPVAKSRGLKRS